MLRPSTNLNPGQCLSLFTASSNAKSSTALIHLVKKSARFKMSLDPTLDDDKKLATSLRKSCREDRVLLHYNGHGVPQPTPTGEVWAFNANYTQYVPLAVSSMPFSG